MTSAAVLRLLEYVTRRHPRSLPGVVEAREIDPTRFDEVADLHLRWAIGAFGDDAIARMVDSFVRFSTDVNLAQARYEVAGQYANKTYEECMAGVYSQDEAMDDYLSGIFLTNFLWAHHFDLAMFFQERFVSKLSSRARLVEIASGHGGWGLCALQVHQGASLIGFDISPKAIEMSTRLAAAAGMSARARYALQNVMDLDVAAIEPVEACICSFLIEHLEQPEKLLSVVSAVLAPRGTAFLTAALTAAQVDHIYEFRFESELVRLAEQHGMRVLDMRSVGPARTLKRARFLPRSAALVLQKRVNETW